MAASQCSLYDHDQLFHQTYNRKKRCKLLTTINVSILDKIDIINKNKCCQICTEVSTRIEL